MTSTAYKERAFEEAVEDHLVTHSWHRGDVKSYDRVLAVDPGEFFAFVKDTQPKAWREVIARSAGNEGRARKELLGRLVDEVNRRGTIRVLRDGFKDRGVKFDVAYFQDAKGLTPELADRYASNRCTVTRQLPYSPDHHNTLDLTLFVNGLPVATAELKNALSGQTVADAKEQYRKDRDPKDVLLSRRAVVHFAVDTDLAFLTTRLAKGATRFLPFNRGSDIGGAGNPPHASGRRTAYLWEEVWQRDAWLDILQRFVHAEPGETKTGKRATAGTVIFPRFHRWDAVRRLRADAAANGPGHAYLVEHSTGSGKSNTVAWLAHQLSTLHDAGHRKVFHKVIVITDRVVLDRQLQGTIAQFDHTPGVVATIDKDSAQLAAKLSSREAQVIVTTLQKFPFVLSQVKALADKSWAIIVDEAHSSQTGETANALKTALGAGVSATSQTFTAAEPDDLAAAEAAEEAEEAANDPEELLARAVETRGRQPNLSWFAFTATPKQKTLELFGTFDAVTEEYRPFHLYSMRQAIEEGFILDVLANYVTYKTYWKLASAAAEDPDVDRAKAAAALARFVSLNPHNLAQKAEVIVEHFRRVTAKKIGGQAKAMVVTRSRLHAVRYKQALDAYAQEMGYAGVNALVAFSGQVTADGVGYTESQMNGGVSETELPDVFGWMPTGDPVQDEGHVLYGVLVVAEKYQTGYDQPLLHTMYVDKKLEGVKAVQTLSRLNRIHPGKDDTFVLDFANDAPDIQEAFRPFFEATLAEPTDPNLIYNAQQAVEDFGLIAQTDVDAFVDAFFTLGANADSKKLHASLYTHLDPARIRFEALDAQDRETIRSALARFVRLYAFLAQVVPFGDEDLEKLYLYGRFLELRLPSEEERGLDLSEDLVLTHLRTELNGTHNLSLAEGGDTLPGFGGDAAGPKHHPELAPLSTVIDQLNERFGTDFTKADQLYFDQLEEAMVEDEELQVQARANTLENFKFGFTKSFEDNVIDRRESNEGLFQRLIDDPDFSTVVRDHLMHKVYGRLKDVA